MLFKDKGYLVGNCWSLFVCYVLRVEKFAAPEKASEIAAVATIIVDVVVVEVGVGGGGAAATATAAVDVISLF